MSIRLGKWQDTLHGETCDALICDPPYSAKTHDCAKNLRANSKTADPSMFSAGLAPDYSPMSNADVFEFVESWSHRVRGWIVCMTDSASIETYQKTYESVGRYAFAPVPCVMRGMSIRISGDGPSSWTVYAMVSRPRNSVFAKWGTLPGAYVGPPSTDAGGGRGKPAWLLRALVRDYSRRGDVVIDPFAGWGSTILAAQGLDRVGLGSEMDPTAHAKAMSNLAKGSQSDLFAVSP